MLHALYPRKYISCHGDGGPSGFPPSTITDHSTLNFLYVSLFLWCAPELKQPLEI